MDSKQKEFVFTNYARSLIEFKARQLSRRRKEFQFTETEDVQQELWLALVKAAEKFDSTKASLNTFTSCVVNTAAAMLLRARRRRKRGNGLCIQSLDGAPNGEMFESLAATVSADDLARHTGVKPTEEIARRENAEAVQHALAQMPNEMRDLCRRLMGGTAVSDLGTSRRQVRKTIAAARPFFERAGF